MDSELSSEGSYDAPLDQLPSSSTGSEPMAASQFNQDRQARIDRVRQRRAEIAQNPSSVSSALTQTSAPLPVTVKDTSSLAAPSPTATLRADMMQEAIDFLNNPRVASAPLATKQKFLMQRKGLTEAEVDEAVRRSNPAAATSAPQMVVAAPQPAPMAPAPPAYYGAPVMYQSAPAPSVAYPSLKSIAFVVVVCVGLASGLIHLFKKYVWSYWFPKKREVDDKILELEARFAKAQELMAAQSNDTRDALGVLRGFLEGQLTDWSERQRLEALKEENDSKTLSELKREVSTVRHLIPSVGNFARSVKTSALQTDVLDEIRNELNSLKNSIKFLVSNQTPSLPRASPSSGNLVELASSVALAAPSAIVEPINPASTTETTQIAQNTQIASPAAQAPASGSLNQSQSKRSRPAWMSKQTPALPAWQMENKPENAENQTNPSTTTPAPSDAAPADLTEPKDTTSSSTEPEIAPELLTAPLEHQPQKTNDEPPYPQSYKDILRMIQQGITPPNVKTDVDDRPRDPEAPLQDGAMKTRTKPWANAGSSAQPLSFNVTEDSDLTDPEIPKNIGSIEPQPSDDEELVLSDIELN